MSSARFPGKVLAPLQGRPIIEHVVSQVAQVIPEKQIIVATSTERSDDPLACYLEELGISVYRGDLNNVFGRFQSCLQAHPCEWFFRICADSPLLESKLLGMMLPHTEGPAADLITNVQVRTFPRGHSVELIKSDAFAGIDSQRLSPAEKEHVTKFYYNHPAEFRIINISSENPALAEVNLAVDTIDDFHRLEEALRLRDSSTGASHRA